jgi:anti-sigma regulatory factor (Ser/Thr protein kinase)
LIDEDKSVEITVADQGKGFDYRSLDFALPDRPAHLERRGYILIGNMADAVRFNGAGNVVTAILKMNEKQDAKEG